MEHRASEPIDRELMSEESEPISIRRLDRLETTVTSNGEGE